jgi:hypothetical protein
MKMSSTEKAWIGVQSLYPAQIGLKLRPTNSHDWLVEFVPLKNAETGWGGEV